MNTRERAGEELLRLVCREHTLQEVVNLAARLLKTHVSFSNSAFQHRCVSANYPQYDIDDRTQYRELHKHDLMYQEMISVMEAKTDHTPFILHTSGPRDRWISKAYYADRHVGHFTAIDDLLSLDQLDTEIMALCCDACAITYAMEHSHKSLSQSMSTDSALFESLLNQRFVRSADFHSSAQLYAFREYPFYRVLCILSARPVEFLTREQLEHLLKDGRTFFCCTTFQSNLAILLGSDAPFPFALDARQEAALETLCRTQGIYVGISDPFSDILQTKPHFDAAARSALYFQSTQPSRHVALHDLCKIPLLFRDAKAHITRPTDYIARRIMEISDYDLVHSTQYLSTLHQYLLCSCSPQQTAAALFLHKNTVIYRVSRMRELFSLNLSDAGERFSYLLSLNLLAEQ